MAEPVLVDSLLLESYTGNYELTTGYVIAITAEEGKLALTQLWHDTSLYLPPSTEVNHFELLECAYSSISGKWQYLYTG